MSYYASLSDSSLKNNAHLYTAEMRAFIQQTIEQCGINVKIAPISGWKAGKKEEPFSFAILPGKNRTLYINIPFGWVSFLHDVLQKKNAHEPLSEEESQKLNSFIWVMHHEMNHVKKIVIGKSYFSQSYPWKRAIFSMIFNMVLWVYIVHTGLVRMPHVLKAALIGGSIGFSVALMIVVSRRCREEYAYDIEGIESVSVLRGGADWLMHDAKAYVDGVFSGKLRFLRFLYKQFPNVLCSIFTLHPHPVLRAAAIEKRIAQLQARG